MGIPTEDFVDTIEWMQEDLQDELGEDATIPLNEEGKEILYTLNPREPKFFPLSIAAAAKIFYAAGASWTLSTEMYDVTNYGYFSGNDEEATAIAKKMFDEVHKLKCKTLVLGECGHGSRALRWEAPNYLKTHPDFKMVTLIEQLEEYIKSGRIKVDKTLNTKKYTIHDPCNIVRNGGLYNSLRYVTRQVVSDFVEMVPNGSDNFCCGGGGGMLAMSEYNERRLKVGKIKADQIAATGAQVVITPCHNCVDQLMQINHEYKLNVEIKSLAEVVADALVL
jgi:Fe-S oxidoreductase